MEQATRRGDYFDEEDDHCGATLVMMLASASPAMAQTQSNEATFGEQFLIQDQFAFQSNAVTPQQQPQTGATTPAGGGGTNGGGGDGGTAPGGSQTNTATFAPQTAIQAQTALQSNAVGQPPVQAQPTPEAPAGQQPDDGGTEDGGAEE